jgi:hypothetical protein
LPFRKVALPRSIFRISWGWDPLAFAPLSILAAGKPGRWDDRTYRFRTGYYSNSFRAAFVEVLSPLRPDPAAIAKLRSLGEPPPDTDRALREYLGSRFAATVITHREPVVDIVHAASRTEFEVLTHRRKRLKAGDFLSRDLRVPRRAAGLIYDLGEAGIRAPSAEGLNLGDETFAMFEESIGAGRTRVALEVGTIAPALDQAADLAEARTYLEI